MKEPIHFRTTTAAYLKRIKNPMEHLESIIGDNVEALHDSIAFCAKSGIGSFRVNSRFLPLATYPDFAYDLSDLSREINDGLKRCKQEAKDKDIRLTFHPDQFVVINSPRDDVVEKSLLELEIHGDLADAIGADVINIHAGGAYDDKEKALERFVNNAKRLSSKVQTRLTVENDDKTYTPSDLLDLPFPLVYDVHHHRCNSDSLSIEEATKRALKTWDREPLFHISSPLNGWKGKNPERHHDYINIHDFPNCWEKFNITVDVEAKAKEKAVLKLLKELQSR